MVKIEKIDEAIHGYYEKTHPAVSADLIEAVLYSVDGSSRNSHEWLHQSFQF